MSTALGATSAVVDAEIVDAEIRCLDREDLDELAYRTDLDPEAQCLNTLMWAPLHLVRSVLEHLTGADFYRPVYGQLFDAIRSVVEDGQTPTPAMVAAGLRRTGTTRTDLHTALLRVTVGDARGEDAGHYALAVLRESYRRGYATAAVRLAQHAAQTAEDELYEQMCVLGRERRTARDRLAAATTALT
jgi:replicative DNA helicase